MNKFLMMVALMAAMSMSVMAQKKQAKIDTMALYNLQEVQVMGTRATKKTPVAFTNVKKEDLKEVNHGKDIPALLTMTPSVTMTSDAGNGIGYTSMYVRGSDNTRVNITANGIPLNDAESSGLYWVNFGDFASSAEDIQIQRGVGTSTNGAGAFGATVNIQTEKIGTKPFVGIDLSAGSYYSHKQTVRFGTGLIGGHWGIQGRLSNIGSKGYIDRASTKLNSYFLQAGYFGDNTVVKFITFNGQEQTYHAWNYASQYEQDMYGRTYNSCGKYKDSFGNTQYYDNQTDNYHSQNYQLIWNQHLGNMFNLNAALHYTRGDGYYEEYKTDADLNNYGLGRYVFVTGKDASGNLTYDTQENFEPLNSDLVRRKMMGNDFYGAVASLAFDNKNGLNAIIGGGWNKYIGDHFGKVIWVRNYDPHALTESDPNLWKFYELEPDFEYYRNRAHKTDFNIYGKVNYELLDGFNVFLDLQYRRVNLKMQDPTDNWFGTNYISRNFGDYGNVLDKTYNFFNPKFGINYDFTPNHKVYASVGVGHKEPTRNDWEENISFNYNTKSYEAKDLKAERLTDIEVGYKYQSEKFSAGANLYYMDYANQFVLTGQINSIGEAIKANSGKSYRMGIELEAAWKPVEWFVWTANATFSKNRNKDWTVELVDAYNGSGYELDANGQKVKQNLGETPISFSPSTIFNNQFTFKYQGFKASVMSHYVSEQYFTNTGFKEYVYYDSDAECEKTVSTMLGAHFTTDIDISYTTNALKKYGMKEATIGVTLYNVFSTKYNTTGWSSIGIAHNSNGQLMAVPSYEGWHYYDDPYETGLGAAAPFNFMVNLSLNF